MQEHRTFISSIQKIDFGPNSTLKAKECRKIEPLSVRYLGQIPHYKPRNIGTSNFYQFPPRIGFMASSTLQAKVCRKFELLSVRSLKLILGQNRHQKPRNAGTSNLYLFVPKNLFNAKFCITSQGIQENRTSFS